MTVAYEGTSFRGFARNDGVPTVAGALGGAIETVLRHPVELTAAGRTDAGVHARGQVVSFDAPAEGLDLERLARSVNGLCAPAIAVLDAAMADKDFSARFSARWRRYRYTVLNRAMPDPFRAATAWHVDRPLDLRAMQLGADPLIGEHDFTSFCRRPRGTDEPPTMVRRVLTARWSDDGDDVKVFDICANAFCHQMVRSVVGLLVDVGLGRRRAGEVLGVLRAKDRARVGTVAPPHGLCLEEVGY